MLEIIVLVLCGRHIASIAKRKNRSPVGYVILMVLSWYGGALCGGILGVVVAEMTNAGPGENDAMLVILPFVLGGAVCGLGLSYLVVCSVSPLAKQRGDYDYDDYDDEPPPRRRYRRNGYASDDEARTHRDDDDDDYRPRSRRRDDDEDFDRPRRRRRDDYE